MLVWDYYLLHFTYDVQAYNSVIIYIDVLPPTNVRTTVVTSRSIQITWEPSLII